MKTMEKDLWEQVKAMHIKEVRKEVEDWVADPSSTPWRASTYDRMIMLY